MIAQTDTLTSIGRRFLFLTHFGLTMNIIFIRFYAVLYHHIEMCWFQMALDIQELFIKHLLDFNSL